jgi:hypothetical protein
MNKRKRATLALMYFNNNPMGYKEAHCFFCKNKDRCIGCIVTKDGMSRFEGDLKNV